MLNPTLSVSAYFSVLVDDENRKTLLKLERYPEVAAWLLTFLDHVLWRQGRLAGERRIAPPPDGPARQALLTGGVLLAGRNPDGSPVLKLNPTFDMRLQVDVRLPGEPARNTLLALAEDADLTRWLLNYYLAPAARVPVPDDPAVVASLRRHGVLVDAPPAPAVTFPDPASEVDLPAELAGAARVFLQEPGQAVPPEVRARLGRHLPPLPAGTALVWAEDAGTGLVYPSLRPSIQPAGVNPAQVTTSAGVARAAQWEAHQADCRRSLAEQHHAVLRDLVPAAQRAKLRRHVRQLVERGYFPAPGDGQVERRAGIHNEPTLAALHEALAGLVSNLGSEPVLASYCYLGCYEAGSVLHRHRDRPQCVYNLSLVLDMQGPDGTEPPPWPIWLEIDGRPVPVLLQVGDGLLYSGTELWHWRDALPPGQRAIVCFYHFVPQGYAGSLD
jgi:hypothetical protein